MRILANNDVKQLVWEGSSSSSVLEGISLQKNIRAKKGEELIHIVFSDSRFADVSAWVSTMRSILPQNILSLEDRLPDFDVEITVLSEEGAYCRAKFRVHTDTNRLSLRMDKISDESGGKWTNIRKRMPF